MWTFDPKTINSIVFFKDGERTNLQIITDEEELSFEDYALANTVCNLLNKSWVSSVGRATAL